MGEGPNRGGNARRWIVQEVEASLRRLGTDWIDLYQVHRWDPGTDIDETLGALTDLVHAGKIRYLGSSTFPAHTIVEAQWTARAARPGAVRVRAAALLDPRPRDRARRTAGLRLTRDGRDPVEPARRRLAHRPLPRKARTCRRAPAPERIPRRYDMSLPGNQAKLEAADALALLADEAGLPLIHIAIAFVLRHPAVTAAIIGPRTMEQLESQLGAAGVELPADVLDRIDEIVPPGTNLNPADSGWTPPWLDGRRAPPPLRRIARRLPAGLGSGREHRA